MTASDIVAYGCDGAEYCPDCQPDGGTDEVWPMFADDARNGMTCNACRCFYLDGGWLPQSDAHELEWLKCAVCNHQEPVGWFRPDTCTSCGKLWGGGAA